MGLESKRDRAFHSKAQNERVGLQLQLGSLNLV